jgi:tetratricopeptide (TPR) repeat protein
VVSPAKTAEPHWVRVSSSHFQVVTNADPRQGQQVAIRFEQMRTAFGQLLIKSRVNLPEPVEIIALRPEDYSAAVPARPDPLLSDAFFISGEDRYYFVLNLAKDDSWRAVSYDFARMLLNYNYPPVQAWFDEGFAQYFSSLRLGRTVEIGREPVSQADRAKPFIPLLSSQPWSATSPLVAPANQPTDTLFAGESWMVMHYLMNRSKLEQTGSYFDLVENQKLPSEQAIQQAYAMAAAQFDEAVKSYFQSLLPLIQNPAPTGKNSTPSQTAGQAPAVASDDEIGSSVQNLPEGVGPALVAEMALRVPEHRSQAINQLNSIVDQPKLDNSVAHRALAFAHLQNGEPDDAMRELAKAADLDQKDPWIHFYAALIRFRKSQASGKEFEGLANMMQDLRAVLDWDPEFAEADNMLGLARVEGGGINSAMQSMHAAMQLSPRNQQYELNMAKIYTAAKKWEAADAMLRRLASSSDPKIAEQARQQLNALPGLQKYGVAPQPNAGATYAANGSSAAKSAATQGPDQPAETKDNEAEEHAGPQIDRRPVQYAKGRLVSVDCSQQPSAVVTFSTGTKTMKLRAENYPSLTLIGAAQFSCDWANRAASVNYKAGGKADGDLVSLELR